MTRHVLQAVMLTAALALLSSSAVAGGSQRSIVLLERVKEMPVAGAEITRASSGDTWISDAHGRAVASLEEGDQLLIQHPGYGDRLYLIFDASASLVVHLDPLPETGLVSLVFQDDRRQPVTPEFVYLGNLEQVLELEVSATLSELIVRLPSDRYAVVVFGQYVDGFGIVREEHGIGEVTMAAESTLPTDGATEGGDTVYPVVVRPQQIVDLEVTFPRLSTLRGFVSGLAGRKGSLRVVPDRGEGPQCGFGAYLSHTVQVDTDGHFEAWLAAGSYSVALEGDPDAKARFFRVDPGQVIALSLSSGD